MQIVFKLLYYKPTKYNIFNCLSYFILYYKNILIIVAIVKITKYLYEKVGHVDKIYIIYISI